MKSSECKGDMLDLITTSTEAFYMTMQVFHIVSCLLAILLTVYSAKVFANVYISINLKILFSFYRAVVATFCCSFISIETYHFVTRFIYVGCDLLVSAKICIWFRIVQSFASVFFQIFYIGVIVDTVCSLFVKWYQEKENCPIFIGWFMILFSVITVGPSVFVDMQTDSYLINCSSYENKPKSVQRNIFIWFIIMDVASISSFMALKCFQTKQMSNPVLKYNVTGKIRARELTRTTELMYPNLLINVVCYLYYAIVSIWLTTSDTVDSVRFMQAYSVPFYILLCPIVWMFVLRRYSKIEVQPVTTTQENYFRHLEATWNRVFGQNDNNKSPRMSRTRKMSNPETLFTKI